MDSFERENLWNFESQYDNFTLFNELSNTVMFKPLIEFQEINSQNLSADNVNVMTSFIGGKQCKNSLRLLSTQYLVQNNQHNQQAEQENITYFCMFSINERNNEKRFSLLPLHNLLKLEQKLPLALDNPNRVIVVNNKMLVAVQKKCITLYRIHNGHLVLKDFDSIGIGNKLVLVDLKHLKYKTRDYLLVFGNEKEDVKPFFKCLVYELTDQKLKFIKKATLFERETYKPIILFDHYPEKQFYNEQFCLVVGGFSDYQQQNYIFGALQIHLHLLIEQWIEYPLKLTKEILFNKKHTITTGKALKVTTDMVSDECWLLFCTQYQTITKMYLHFGHQNEQYIIQNIELDTKILGIRDEKKGQIEPIYYGENTLYLLRVPDSHPESKHQIPYRIYWCDKKIQRIRSRPLRQILTLFFNS